MQANSIITSCLLFILLKKVTHILFCLLLFDVIQEVADLLHPEYDDSTIEHEM